MFSKENLPFDEIGMDTVARGRFRVQIKNQQLRQVKVKIGRVQLKKPIAEELENARIATFEQVLDGHRRVEQLGIKQPKETRCAFLALLVHSDLFF